MKNDLLLRVLQRKTVVRTPVWIMRQAGRILPEYRAIRKEVKDFTSLLKNPSLAAEITLQPIKALDVDAVIIFSDILVVPEAMGLSYQIVENKGPYFLRKIENQKDIEALHTIHDSTHIEYVIETIRLVKKKLHNQLPLIGFAGGPFTIFCYMIEGSSSKTFSKARKMLYTDPNLAHQLIERITESTIFYLKAQIAAGVDLVQIFDSWAGIIPYTQYIEFNLPYIQKICKALENKIPKIIFSRGIHQALKDLGNIPCQAISLDWNIDIGQVKKIIKKDKVLQGNLDPCVLYASAGIIEQETQKMIEAFNGYSHIANLGHGVYPNIPLENVKLFIETVKNYTFRKWKDSHVRLP